MYTPVNPSFTIQKVVFKGQHYRGMFFFLFFVFFCGVCTVCLGLFARPLHVIGRLYSVIVALP